MRSSRVIHAVDLHAGGAPGRVLLDCYVGVRGTSMIERLDYCRANLESLRRFLLHEPRGYPALTCNLLTPPCRSGADVGYICLEQGGFTPMSGSNTICVVTALLETGMLPATEGANRVVVDTPAGIVPSVALVENGRVVDVEFENVPAFLAERDVDLAVDGLGTVRVDVAYGGQYYVLASIDKLDVDLELSQSRDLARVGSAILAAAQSSIPVRHPLIPSIDSITWALLYDRAPADGRARSCVVGPTATGLPAGTGGAVGIIDRSPCGTGTSARLAQLFARGEMIDGATLRHDNLLGSHFTGRIVGLTRVGPIPAIRTTISGRAFVTGFAQIMLDGDDPYPTGFTIGDIWGAPEIGGPDAT